ncbi:MAG: Gfo/Idh/MocA family oxidoreductase [Planctomycetaceae bacterium]
MQNGRLRVGIVGAGENTRLRHIPGLRAQPDVEILGVANRTAESGRRAAAELGIARNFANWQELIAAPEIDAVVIGTWPNLHCNVTCAALAARKHVLVEARMARTLGEARQMLAASRAQPDLIAQIVPSPLGLQCGATVARVLNEGTIGDLRELVVLGITDAMWDDSRPVHWRQDSALSGRNVLTLGILHETVLRWLPQPQSVVVQSATFSRRAPVADAPAQRIDIPDVLHVLSQLPGGAQGVYHLSGVALFGPPLQVHLYGSRGTLKIEFGATERVWLGRTGDAAIQELTIPAAERGDWRVEEEFVRAIRGQEQVRLTDFGTGVRYMAFTEAVMRSAETGERAAVTVA